MRQLLIVPFVVISSAIAFAASDPALNDERALLERIHDVVSHNYYPEKKAGKEFDQRCAEADRAIASAKTNGQANAIIADTLSWLDPRIRFYPAPLRYHADYSWRWRLHGDLAFVTLIDSDGDALKQGLQLGDRIIALEDIPLDRASAPQLLYAFYRLDPRAALRVKVQSPGNAPRELTLATTMRPPRRKRYEMGLGWQPTLTEHEKKEMWEFADVEKHVHRFGPVLYWRALELHGRGRHVGNALDAIKDASTLIVDLRGMQTNSRDAAIRLLDGIFAEDFEVGVAHENERDRSLHVGGGKASFHGTVLVLTDSITAGYAEVVAHVIGRKLRGVVIGDRTAGTVFESRLFYGITNVLGGVFIPTGEIELADGTILDGHGVIPNVLLNPKPDDLFHRRDIVLTRALAMVKQTVSPEDAYRISTIEPPDDE